MWPVSLPFRGHSTRGVRGKKEEKTGKQKQVGDAGKVHPWINPRLASTFTHKEAVPQRLPQTPGTGRRRRASRRKFHANCLHRCRGTVVVSSYEDCCAFACSPWGNRWRPLGKDGAACASAGPFRCDGGRSGPVCACRFGASASGATRSFGRHGCRTQGEAQDDDRSQRPAFTAGSL